MLEKTQLDAYAVVCDGEFCVLRSIDPEGPIVYAGNVCLSIVTLLRRARRKKVIVEDETGYFGL